MKKLLQRFKERREHRRMINKYFTFTRFGVKVDPAWYGENEELTQRLWQRILDRNQKN